jgi:hypothetical protein
MRMRSTPPHINVYWSVPSYHITSSDINTIGFTSHAEKNENEENVFSNPDRLLSVSILLYDK